MPERPSVHVHLLPALIPPGALKGGVAVVVDVLRATTVMVQALASGCEAIIPCGEIDEARAVAASLPPGTALLGGERGGLPIEGFDLGNSPGDYTPEVCRGKTLVMTTTNGTRAILASQEAERVLIGAFVNLEATAEALFSELDRRGGRPVHIVCAGTEGFITLEDSLLAGALVKRVCDAVITAHGPPAPFGNDEAMLVCGHWECIQRAVDSGVPLADMLALGRGGQNVQRIGLGADLAVAARSNRFDLMPELRRDPLRIVAIS